MKILNVKSKVIKELTRYIRPKEIEAARFKQYCQPIIDDGNIVCDEFFRTKELYNPAKDFAPVANYSIDDIPVTNRVNVLTQDALRLKGINPAKVEWGLPYYVDIIGRNERIYLESYGLKDPKHPQKMMADGIYSKFVLDDVVNIKYYAQELSLNDKNGFTKEALALLKDGFPLTSVLKLMEKSALKSSDGISRTSKGLLTFLAEFPKFRPYVITHDFLKNEVFDSEGAKMFPKILEMCNNDHEEAFRIINDCRRTMYDESRLTDTKYLELGQKLYKIDNTWSTQKAEIVKMCILKYRQKNIINKVKLMIWEEKPIDRIHSFVLSSKK